MKTLWTIIIIIIIVLIGWYLYASYTASPSYTAPTSETTTETPQPVTSDTNTPATGPSTAMGINGGAGQTNTGQVSVPAVLTVATDQKLGNYLIAANGMTLYTYAKDTAGVSKCTGTCLANWPAYTPTANEPLVAGTGVTGKISTITRADGTVQLTYKGLPVYFYVQDQAAGDVKGQGVGGVWYVVKP